MNIKYKKAVLLILMSTMGVGILTISITPHSDKSMEVTEATSSDALNVTDDQISHEITNTPTETPLPTQTPSSTPVPTTSEQPVYALEKKGYPKIEALIKDYYDAKLNCDAKTLKTLLSNPSDVPSKEVLQNDVMFVEEYQSIKCYVQKSYEENSYIVYVYYEIKFMNIDTPAPSMDRFYLTPDSEGNERIYSDTLEGERKAYCDERKKDDDVQKLFKDTEAKGKKAREKDELLKTFWEGLIALTDSETDSSSGE